MPAEDRTLQTVRIWSLHPHASRRRDSISTTSMALDRIGSPAPRIEITIPGGAPLSKWQNLMARDRQPMLTLSAVSPAPPGLISTSRAVQSFADDLESASSAL